MWCLMWRATPYRANDDSGHVFAVLCNGIEVEVVLERIAL
jgi:hypothetical protein